ncbi:cytochrome o ubiquinol oxidase subunit IV [Mesorhizobium sp. ISC11]|uniref:cytochrome o ubiquinol oxidase subunit IV n=1 Tax=Mesorhizobium sp. ISC11 TaxID=3076428 RepID=UPI00301CFBF2
MSAGHQTDTSNHSHAHHGVNHGSLAGYLTGFGLCVVLTAVPFWLVMTNALGNQMASAIAIMAFAVVQIIVHIVFFLHMNTRSESGWTMMALIFTLILVMIALTGSLWVMYHLNVNMMPGHDMSQIP